MPVGPAAVPVPTRPPRVPGGERVGTGVEEPGERDVHRCADDPVSDGERTGEPESAYWSGQSVVALLGCDCGEVGCWPLEVRIVRSDSLVTWCGFTQPFRQNRRAAADPAGCDHASVGTYFKIS